MSRFCYTCVYMCAVYMRVSTRVCIGVRADPCAYAMRRSNSFCASLVLDQAQTHVRGCAHVGMRVTRETLDLQGF